MARNFANSLRVPYQGILSNAPIQLCGGANVVGFDFPWRQYGTYLGSNRTVAVNPGVTFSMVAPPQVILKSVQGVFIDNTNCASPVYLECFDTKHVVACADNSTAFFPLLTGGTEFTLYIDSMEQPFTSNQTTRVFMMDTPVSPFAQQQASNAFITLSQLSGDNVFVPTILADQVLNQSFGDGGLVGENVRTFDIIGGSGTFITIIKELTLIFQSGTANAGGATFRAEILFGGKVFTTHDTGSGTARTTLVNFVTLTKIIPKNEKLQVRVTSRTNNSGNFANYSYLMQLAYAEVTALAR